MYSVTSKGQSIHINPVFKNKVLQKIKNDSEDVTPPSSNAHINPLFINSSIHMNPEFLNVSFQQQIPDSNELAPTEKETVAPQLPKVTQLNKIISKSRTRIVRESHPQTIAKTSISPAKTTSPILLLTKRKLVRATTNTLPNTTTVHKEIVKRKLKYKLIKSNPLERALSMLKRRPKAFVGRYALRRTGNQSDKLTVTAFIRSKPKGSTSTTTIPRSSLNTRLRFININDILYKSLRNKLQRRDESPADELSKNVSTGITITKPTKKTIKSTEVIKGRTVYVRGAKFVLDPKGFKLTRVNQANTRNSTEENSTKSPKILRNTTTSSLSVYTTQSRRIDIGGLTYIASKQFNNVYVRTSTHLALAHLNQAKQRSVNVLSRCLRKVNKPCVIFQRLGKCAAFERNRCSKIHDRQQVSVCPKFLKGQCTNPDCLLSHNISFQKMPVCKFFLQGTCVRTDCLYLHKKLSEDSEICENFRHGFCALAEKCNKQHIFPGPRQSKIQVNTDNLTSQQHYQKEKSPSPVEENALTSRYFNGDSFVLGLDNDNTKDTISNRRLLEKENKQLSNSENDDDNDDNVLISVMKRKPLGTLPSFIPLS